MEPEARSQAASDEHEWELVDEELDRSRSWTGKLTCGPNATSTRIEPMWELDRNRPGKVCHSGKCICMVGT